jgi:hypothetical protein
VPLLGAALREANCARYLAALLRCGLRGEINDDDYDCGSRRGRGARQRRRLALLCSSYSSAPPPTTSTGMTPLYYWRRFSCRSSAARTAARPHVLPAACGAFYYLEQLFLVTTISNNFFPLPLGAGGNTTWHAGCRAQQRFFWSLLCVRLMRTPRGERTRVGHAGFRRATAFSPNKLSSASM